MWKVIIADDEKLICRLVQALIDWEKMGMRVEATAENGLEALEKVKELDPDILITDIRMPGLSGLELIRQVREMKPELEIIIISGYAHFEYARSAITYGVGNYILKPIRQEELQETLVKIKTRLEEKKELQMTGAAADKSRQKDLSRLRESLVRDLLAGGRNFSEQDLKENYHFMAQRGFYQAFVLKIDFEGEGLGEPSLSVIYEKARELFESGMSGRCAESLIVFQGRNGYGLLNYQEKERDNVRFGLREFLKMLVAKRNLFGEALFSLGLGSPAAEPKGLEDSMEEAKQAVCERLLEGCGRMLEGAPAPSKAPKQELLDRFIKETERAIEVLDMEEVRKANGNLKQALLAVPDIRGREILEVVLSVGKFFVLRTGAQQAEKLQQEFDAGCRKRSSVDGLFMELEKLQQGLLLQAQAARGNEASRPIRLAKQYIMQNYSRNITLEEVCEHTGFSVAYFSALFKKETGEGFARYLTRIRMEEAKTLLRETGLPVAEICEKVGYNDRKHFTHTFHKMTGVNPAEYRKLYG